MPGINCFNKVDMMPMSVANPEKLAAQKPAIFMAHPDMSGVEGVPRYFWKVDGNAVVEMNQTEKDAVTATEIVPAKRVKYAEIMWNTPNVMEASGFVHNSKTFPMDTASMAQTHLLYDGRNQLTYPFIAMGKGGESFESIADATEMQAFAGKMIQAVDAAKVAEKDVLQTVKDLTDLEAVKDFVDPR